jgi:predicted MFS family arabinose efflux permease
LSLLAASALLAHQIAYMIGRGYDPVFAATVAGMVGVASLPGRYAINRLTEVISPQLLLAVCTGTQGLGTMLLASADSQVWLWAYVLVYGGSFGALSALRAAALSDHFGRRAYGLITALHGAPVALTSALGPLLAGLAFDRLHSYVLVLWACAGIFLAAAMVISLTPRAGPASDPVPLPDAA